MRSFRTAGQTTLTFPVKATGGKLSTKPADQAVLAIPAGVRVTFDETALNGPVILTQLTAAGATPDG